MKFQNLSKYFKTENGELVDFIQTNLHKGRKETPLLFFLRYKINLTEEEISELINSSNVNQKDVFGINALMLLGETKNKLSIKHKQNIFLNTDFSQKNNANEPTIIGYLINPFKLNEKLLLEALKKSNVYDNICVLEEALNLSEKDKKHISDKIWVYLFKNSNLSLIKDENLLLELKKIKSRLLNEEILNKIDIKQEIKKNNKI